MGTASLDAGRAAGDPPPATVAVWDPLVRVLHWTLVAAFAIAFISGDEVMQVHLVAGYTVLAIVGVRSLWGWVGTPHARFDDFVPGPRTLRAYVGDLIRRRARRYIGHNPAGGAMIVAMLFMLVATSATGVLAQSPGANHHLLEEIHEACANVNLALVGLHLTGVVVSSLMHRENLVAAMFSGRKRP